MQLPTSKTPISRCISLGLYSQTMLGKFPQNATLAAMATVLTDATSALSADTNAHREAVIALIAKRVQVKYADYVSDKAVRTTQRLAEIADGKKDGKIGRALFPDGVTPIVRPVGGTQVSEMRKLEGRLDAAVSSWPGASEQRTIITAEREGYEKALGERKAGMTAAADLRAKRNATKEDFLDVYATVAARVKAEFPRDKVMQDLFFDKLGRSSASGDDEDDDEVDDDDGTGGAPA